jgi:hypothetical protein
MEGGSDLYYSATNLSMKLPHPEQAVIDLQKLTSYCLDLEHPDGQHKARVFKSALGIVAENVEELQLALLEAIQTQESIPIKRNQYGQKYLLDFRMTRLNQSVIIRSVWMVRDAENFPRLVTCYVL